MLRERFASVAAQQKMPRAKSNLSCWISLINTCSRQGLHKETLHLFHQMQTQGHQPNRFVLPAALRACSRLSDLKSGASIHTLTTRALFDRTDSFVGSALINMYTKCGRLEFAARVFDRMSVRDLVVWNSMVSGYAHCGLPEAAMVLVKKMQTHGPEPDLVTWNALVSGLSQTSNHGLALDLLDSMRASGIEPDVYTWTSVVSGFVRNFDYDGAVKMFKEMVASGVWPNSATISSLLPALANIMNLKKGKELHCCAVVIGVVQDLFVSSSLVDMYAKCGLVLEAEVIFDSMRVRNAVLWNSMMFAYSNHGCFEKAIGLFDRMRTEGVKPDHLTFTALFTACSHVGMIEVGRDLFRSMQEKYMIEPRLEHYACMVDLLGRAGKLVDAYDLIKEMPVRPDSFVWGALLGACWKHGNVELAELATSQLLELEPESSGSCVTLANVLVDAGRLGDAVEMNQLIRKRKLKRYLGCSWMQSAR